MKFTLVALFATLCISSSAFAVQYCRIQGTADTVGIFPGDNTRGPSIYIRGRGYYPITKSDNKKERYSCERTDRDPVIVDFKRRTLQIDGKTLGLVSCVQNGSE